MINIFMIWLLMKSSIFEFMRMYIYISYEVEFANLQIISITVEETQFSAHESTHDYHESTHDYHESTHDIISHCHKSLLSRLIIL